MQFYFFDTSGAVKMYSTEPGSDKVNQIYSSPDVGIIFVSADDKLCTAATNEGLQVLNPEK
jgi:predicted nucleic acid-binding protein